MLNAKSLQDKGHRVQSGHHTKVEDGGGPAETGGILGGRRSGVIHDLELQIGCHAEK